MLQAKPHAIRDILRRLHVVALHIDDAHGHVHPRRDLCDQLDLGKLAARHLDVQLVRLEIEKRRKHRRNPSRSDRPSFEISEAQVRAQAGAPVDRLHRAVENIHEAPGIFLVGVATHRGLIDADLPTARGDEVFEFFAHHWEQRLGHRPAVGILRIRHQPAAQRIRPRHTRLQRRRADRREALQPLELLHDPQSARRHQFAGDRVLAALVVGGRAKLPRRRRLQLEALDVTVERQIEIEPRLLAIRDDVEPRLDLIVHRRDHGIVLDLAHIGATKDFEVLAGELEPAGKRVAPDDGAAKGTRFHRETAGNYSDGLRENRTQVVDVVADARLDS